MRPLLLLLFLLFSSFLPLSVRAAESHDIAAVVNDDIVTRLEVEDRIKMVIATTGLRDAPDVRARLKPQIVRALIDERLQLQAAAKLSIAVSAKEKDQAVAMIERQRGRPPGSLRQYLEERGVPFYTFAGQIEAQFAWNKLIGRKVASRLAVSDEELARRIDLARRSRHDREEVLLSSILLPVDKPESEAAARDLARKLVSEIRGGANFEAVAAQFSRGPQPLGKVWVNVAQMDPLLAAEARKAEAPGLLDPIRTAAGYHILYLQDRRVGQGDGDAELAFKEIVLSLGRAARAEEVDVMMSVARSIAGNPGTCREKNVAGIASMEGLNIKVDYTRARLSTLAPEIVPLVRDLELEEISEPYAAPDGIRLLMLCEKAVLPAKTPNVDRIREQILQEKLEREAIRYLRSLRREAFIEVRS